MKKINISRDVNSRKAISRHKQQKPKKEPKVKIQEDAQSEIVQEPANDAPAEIVPKSKKRERTAEGDQ